MSWTEAIEVKTIAKRLIGERHTHLADVHIEYLFALEPLASKGKEIDGEVKKVSGLNAYLASLALEFDGDEFVAIIISKSAWDLYSESQREASIDKRLCEIRLSDKMKIQLVGPDAHAYYANVRIYGDWEPDLQTLRKLFKQPLLPHVEGPKGKSKAVSVKITTPRLNKQAAAKE
ncbi:MAG: hypothetical protein HY231_24170 [Acidobacteria bacterium]|nr:hypothetical protein [Acidobacteriota bacterium]